MWTIIEDNTAIICACLPMCKRTLAALIPCLSFEGRQKPTNRSSNVEESQTSAKRRHRWTHFFDGTTVKEQAALMLDPRKAFTHSKVQTGSYPSEEFIMSPVHEGRRAETPGSEEGGRHIRKVTRYEVAYDDAAPLPRTARKP
ncbi:hypothetical protein diail_413 [Diaporthe ilicicola]|nr:hypothetical protein diail_413 [Diaporthe ilicicola]